MRLRLVEPGPKPGVSLAKLRPYLAFRLTERARQIQDGVDLDDAVAATVAEQLRALGATVEVTPCST